MYWCTCKCDTKKTKETSSVLIWVHRLPIPTYYVKERFTTVGLCNFQTTTIFEYFYSHKPVIKPSLHGSTILEFLHPAEKLFTHIKQTTRDEQWITSLNFSSLYNSTTLYQTSQDEKGNLYPLYNYVSNNMITNLWIICLFDNTRGSWLFDLLHLGFLT